MIISLFRILFVGLAQGWLITISSKYPTIVGNFQTVIRGQANLKHLDFFGSFGKDFVIVGRSSLSLSSLRLEKTELRGLALDLHLCILF